MKVRLAQLLRGGRYGILRLLSVLLSVLMVFLYQQIPDRRIVFVPSEHAFPALYGPSFNPESQSGNQHLSWINKDNHKWHCVNPANFDYSCGYSLSLQDALNLEGFTSFNIKLNYVGDAAHLRFSVRNFNPVYAKENRAESSKFMSVLLQKKDLDKEVSVKITEFTVAEWWMKEFDIPREYAAPELDNIISFGIDFISESDNVVEVEKIELVGAWLTKEQLYFGILVFWLMIAIGESIAKFVQLYHRYVTSQEITARLVAEYKKLEKTKNQYATLSTTDILTGALNRAGIQAFLEELSANSFEKRPFGIMLFDVDHFKQINDTRGHDCGDRVLVELAQVIKSATRDSDLFGRWGGEEFILVCPLTTEQRLKDLAEKLRHKIESHNFEADKPISVTVSIGATLTDSSEAFASTYKRIDNALYEAKSQGRNTVVFVNREFYS